MLGIGLLLLMVIAVVAIRWLLRDFPLKVKVIAWFGLVVFAGSFPFWHFLYPSYREFARLCERPDRHVVHRNVEVDFAFLDRSSFYSYKLSEKHGFKGFDVKLPKTGYLRYSKSDNWGSAVCQRDCADPSVFVWEKTCEVNCLTRFAVTATEFEAEWKQGFTDLVNERLVHRWSKALAPTGEVLLTSSDYTYYPYGTGWARMLGGSSGSPPSLACPTQFNIDMLEFLRPKSPK